MSAGLLVGAAASALIPHLPSLLPLVILWAIESLGYTASVVIGPKRRPAD